MVSVIIPVYNRIDTLRRAIDSALRQSYKNIEILVIDDCSDKPILSLTQSFNTSLIKYFRFDKKTNANVARNKGVKESEGEYIAFLDSDDTWGEAHLENSIQFIEENKLNGVYSGIRIQRKINNIYIPRNINKDELFINYLFEGGICQTSTIVVERKCILNNLFDESLERHQDWDFSIRFHNKYNFKLMNECNVNVYWNQVYKRQVNLSASKLFINKYCNEISNKNYHKYHRNMYHSAKKICASDNVISYYENNSFCFKKDLTKVDYMSIYNPKTLNAKIFYSLKYLLIKYL